MIVSSLARELKQRTVLQQSRHLPAQVSTSALLVGGAVQSGTTAAPMPLGGAIGNSFVRNCSSACGTANLACGQVASLTQLDLGWSVGCQATSRPKTSSQSSLLKIRRSFA